MIDMGPLKEQSSKFSEPLKSIIEMAKNSMPEQDFVEFFISMRKKARELDAKKEVQK